MTEPTKTPSRNTSTTGKAVIAVGVMGFVASAALGGGTLIGALVAGLLNPLFFIGVPVGWYLISKSKENYLPAQLPSDNAAKQWPSPPVYTHSTAPSNDGCEHSPLSAFRVATLVVCFSVLCVCAFVIPMIVALIGSDGSALRYPLPHLTSPDQVRAKVNWTLGDNRSTVEYIEGVPRFVTVEGGYVYYSYGNSDRVVFQRPADVVVGYRNVSGKLAVLIDMAHVRKQVERSTIAAVRVRETADSVANLLGTPHECDVYDGGERQHWRYSLTDGTIGQVVLKSGRVDHVFPNTELESLFRDSKKQSTDTDGELKKTASNDSPSSTAHVPKSNGRNGGRHATYYGIVVAVSMKSGDVVEVLLRDDVVLPVGGNFTVQHTRNAEHTEYAERAGVMTVLAVKDKCAVGRVRGLLLSVGDAILVQLSE